MYGGHCLKSYSSTQATIALSSAEAEYYALIKSASIALGMRAMYQDLEISIGMNLHTDASGAKGIATRRGLGKLRHLAVHLLWLQHQVWPVVDWTKMQQLSEVALWVPTFKPPFPTLGLHVGRSEAETTLSIIVNTNA